MPGTGPLRLPLPRNWPRRVRSVVIHAISLAHFSLICSRGRAARVSVGRLAFARDVLAEIRHILNLLR